MKRVVYQKETGIILSVIPYGDNGAIAKTFTKELGLVSFFLKNAMGNGRFICFEPFTLAEFAYEEGASSLLKLKEFTCLDAHISLRENLERIESASLIAKALDRTQGPGLSAPSLFALLSLYLRGISKVKDPTVLGASFLLKLLKHEGLFYYSRQCYECGGDLAEAEASEGILRCLSCKKGSGSSLNQEEAALFALLSEARELKELQNIALPDGLLGKINQFFEASLQE